MARAVSTARWMTSCFPSSMGSCITPALRSCRRSCSIGRAGSTKQDFQRSATRSANASTISGTLRRYRFARKMPVRTRCRHSRCDRMFRPTRQASLLIPRRSGVVRATGIQKRAGWREPLAATARLAPGSVSRAKAGTSVLLPLDCRSEDRTLCGRRFRVVVRRRYRQQCRNSCLALDGFHRSASENQRPIWLKNREERASQGHLRL